MKYAEGMIIEMALKAMRNHAEIVSGAYKLGNDGRRKT